MLWECQHGIHQEEEEEEKEEIDTVADKKMYTCQASAWLLVIPEIIHTTYPLIFNYVVSYIHSHYWMYTAVTVSTWPTYQQHK